MSAEEAQEAKSNAAKAKPTVFLAYPFGQRYEWIKDCLPRLLQAYGCQVKTGEKYWGKGISVAVGNDIAASDLLVAFLTRHQQLANKAWVASEWVLQEIGFARGRGIPVVLIRELGVETQIGIAGDVQFIELDADFNPFQACAKLRLAIRDLLFNGQDDGMLTLYHLSKPSGEDAKGKQWYDFWLWVGGSDETLDQISEVLYQFPEGFKPAQEMGEPRSTFDSWGETDTSFSVTAEIRFGNDETRKKMVRHIVRVPGSGNTNI